ncbi:MAG: hypothetical protein AAGD38_16200 [Acidobacteriota bacterium]
MTETPMTDNSMTNHSTPTHPDIKTRIARFVDDPTSADFATLALAAFAFQYEHIEPYRNLCDARGIDPTRLDDWRAVPAVPTGAFATTPLHAAEPREIFRSSGTTGPKGGARSVHHHPFPDLYRHVIDASFPHYCLPTPTPLPMLALIPSRDQLGDSSLGFMTDHVLRNWGAPESRYAFGPHGVETDIATNWCAEQTRPVLILTTAFALVDWLDSLDTPLQLPAGSVIFETGGTKGRTREVSRSELIDMITTGLSVPHDHVVREYGMTELTSQLYGDPLHGGDPDVLVAPHWVRVRILDPISLEEVATGEEGLISFVDLGNLGSAIHVLTEDIGYASGSGIVLVGRASGAQLRGCSLTVEELSRG